jgi:hypothetical protein
MGGDKPRQFHSVQATTEWSSDRVATERCLTSQTHFCVCVSADMGKQGRDLVCPYHKEELIDR